MKKKIERSLGFSLGSGTSSLPTMYFINDSTGLLAGSDGSFAYRGKIARTTNGGRSWSFLNLTTNSVINAIHFPTEDTGYIITRSGNIYRSINKGLSWDSLIKLGTGTISDIFFINGTTGIVISGSKIFNTMNAGIAWYNENPGTTHNLNSLFLNGSGYIAGDSGTILKSTNIAANGLNDAYNKINFKVYPNPANDNLFISGFNKEQTREIKITNELGEIMLQQTLGPTVN